KIPHLLLKKKSNQKQPHPIFFFKQKTAYEITRRDWSSDVCSSDLRGEGSVEKLSRIKLKIPAGIREGTRLRSPGNGEAGIGGGAAGDLYVVVHMKEHSIFHREADDLYCDVPIPFSIAALGGEIDVPTLEGKALVKVPAGTQSGQMFKLRGKGITNVNGRSHGDLYARLIVEVPSRL